MSTSEWNYRPREFQVWSPEEYDLSGTQVDVPIYGIENLINAWGGGFPTLKAVIKNVMVSYTEATDSSNSNIVKIGSDTDNNQFHQYTTPSGKSVGDMDIIEQSDINEPRVFEPVKTLHITCGGGTGSGKVRIGVTLTQDGTEWVGFNETTGK